MSTEQQQPILVSKTIDLDVKTGVASFKLKGDAGVYDTGLDHWLVEIVRASISYALNPIRQKIFEETNKGVEYVRFICEFPIYDSETNITTVKMDANNIHHEHSQLVFLNSVEKTLEDLAPIILGNVRTYLKSGLYAEYERKLWEIKAIDAELEKLYVELEKGNRRAKIQGKITGLTKFRILEADELKKDLKAALITLGLPMPQSRIRFNGFIEELNELVFSGEFDEANRRLAGNIESFDYSDDE